MNKIAKLFITLTSAFVLTLATISSAFAKVEGDTIVLGAAVSLTGKYSSNGVHTQNGYNLAVERLEVLKGCDCKEYDDLKAIIAGEKVSKY